MNQILVTEKLYVTPELRRKKKLYKFNFILSIAIIAVLCSVYIHSEYARDKEQELSQDLLSGMIENEEEMTNAEREIAENEDNGVWKIMISSVQQQTEQKEENTTSNEKTSDKKKTIATYITASNGKKYPSIGRIQIPKINVDYAILDEATGDTLVKWLKISPCKFYGVNPNEVGNFCIAGHNYRNKRFFSKVPTLKVGDKIKITDLSNKTITYTIYDKYTVDPENVDCLDQVTNGKKIVTLITCTNDSKQRVIVKAREK